MQYLKQINMKISDHITYAEAIHSNTAKRRGIDNTPSEIQVADLVKEGKTTKDIANLLNSTPRAIEFHRNNLRKKLGITNKKTNLRSYLLSLTYQYQFLPDIKLVYFCCLHSPGKQSYTKKQVTLNVSCIGGNKRKFCARGIKASRPNTIGIDVINFQLNSFCAGYIFR